ncbi:MAG: cyclase family protein [Chloroflexales bacterium]|nr:cyclase family protein [Chloroflexales bacterium]
MCLPQTFASVEKTISRRGLFKLGAGAAAVAAAVAPNTTLAQQRRFSFANVQDLTHVIGLDTPVYPAFSPPVYKTLATIEENGIYANQLTLAEHTGTHMDAPAHFAANGLYIDQIPATSLIAPFAVLDIKAKVARDVDAEVEPDDVLAWERRYGRLPDGAAVFMNSGWGARYATPSAFVNQDSSGVLHFPGFSPETVEFLLAERNVVGIGVDTLSLDHGPSPDFATHNTWLPTNRWGIENLANLDSAPPSGAFVFVGAPKFAGGSGGPCRIIALY